MAAQSIVVTLVVTGSFSYAIWALMPQALRRGLLAALRKTPLRAWLHEALPGAAGGGGACGSCGSCASSNAKTAAVQTSTVAPLHFVPKASRR